MIPCLPVLMMKATVFWKQSLIVSPKMHVSSMHLTEQPWNSSVSASILSV